MPKRRAVVAIGVKNSGGLMPLESAPQNAHDVAKWLGAEGFENVVIITDDEKPVTRHQISNTVRAIVNEQVYDQVVVYFSGHGIWKNRDELWLLSEAPGDEDTAVSWESSVSQAWYCGIPSVVMISDACRTRGNEQHEDQRGGTIFPLDKRPGWVKVDTLRAAAINTPAFEIKLKANQLGAGEPANDEIISVFTYCLRQAYIKPDPDMVLTLEEDGEKLAVVPNRRLENFVRREVAAVLKKAARRLTQEPEVRVPSEESVYIARVEALPSPPHVATGSLRSVIERTLAATQSILPDAVWQYTAPIPYVGQIADTYILKSLAPEAPVPLERLDVLARRSGFTDALAAVRASAEQVAGLETTGFTVGGIGVLDAAATPGVAAQIRAKGDARAPAVISVSMSDDRSAGTVVLRLSNRNGVPLAALGGYVGHVVVEDGAVAAVKYIPAKDAPRWGEYAARRDAIESLRDRVAAAARLGVLRLDDKADAKDLADRIRKQKAFDPALGLYAAYAYAQAGQEDQVRSILDYMHQDLFADLYDVAMLARVISGPTQSRPMLAPFCPLLTQGWNLLRTRRLVLPKILDDAQDHLVPALWTTFSPERAAMIIDAVRTGDLQ
jgi:Caspase domain